MAETSKCPNCGTPLPANAVMCTQCGTNIKTGERFGTKVDTAKAKKKKPKQPGKSPSVGVIIAIVVIAGGIYALDWHEKQRTKNYTEIRTSISEGMKRAQREQEKKNTGEAAAILGDVKNEIEARKVEFASDKQFAAELEERYAEVTAALNAAKQAGQQQKLDAAKQARENEERERMLKKGYVLFQGKWRPPVEVRAMGFRLAQGKYVSTDVLLQFGWVLIRGEYRSPRELHDMGYRRFEGEWRAIDYIRQARGEVEVNGQWKTEEEALADMPSKVATRSDPNGWVGHVKNLPGGGVEVSGPYMKKLPNVLVVQRRTFLFPRKPGGDRVPGRGRMPNRWLRPGLRLARLAKTDDFYHVRTPGDEGTQRTGYVRAQDVAVAEEMSTRKVSWPNTKMMEVARVKVMPLAPIAKQPLDRMKTERSTFALRRLAEDWETKPDLSHWPNCRWKAQRCRDMADLVDKGVRLATARDVELALAAQPPTDPKLPGGEAIAATRPSSQPRAATGTAPKPTGQLVVVAEKATVVIFKGKTQQPIATVAKGTKLPFFRQTSTWYLVEVDTAKGKKQGWIGRSQVQAPGAAPAPAPKPAPKPKETWVTIASSQAKLLLQKDGKWTTVATLSKGDKARVIKTKGDYHWATATVKGTKVWGWLHKKHAQ